MHTTQGLPEQFSASDMIGAGPRYLAPLVLTEQAAPAGNRAWVTSMATMYSTTRLLMRVMGAPQTLSHGHMV